MANGTWMTHGRGAHGGACCSTYAAGPGLPPSTAASEAGVACPRWLRHPLCQSHQFSRLPGFLYRWPCPRITASPSAGRHSFPAPPAASARLTSNMARTRRMQYTGQGPALQSRQRGTPAGDKDRKSPDLTFVAPSHQSNPERQSGTSGGPSWRGTPSPPPSGGETESQRGGTLMASVSSCYKRPSGLSTSTWPRTSMPTGHPTHAGDGMP